MQRLARHITHREEEGRTVVGAVAGVGAPSVVVVAVVPVVAPAATQAAPLDHCQIYRDCAMIPFVWQDDIIGVARFIDACLEREYTSAGPPMVDQASDQP